MRACVGTHLADVHLALQPLRQRPPDGLQILAVRAPAPGVTFSCRHLPTRYAWNGRPRHQGAYHGAVTATIQGSSPSVTLSKFSSVRCTTSPLGSSALKPDAAMTHRVKHAVKMLRRLNMLMYADLWDVSTSHLVGFTRADGAQTSR